MSILKTLTFMFQYATILSKLILIWQANCQRNWTYIKQTSANKCTFLHSIAEQLPLRTLFKPAEQGSSDDNVLVMQFVLWK
jgi:hypothetical protein